MASLYLILTSLIFPVLAISWLCCIACCIYRGLLRNLNKPGRTTKVQVFSKASLLRQKPLFLSFRRNLFSKYKLILSFQQVLVTDRRDSTCSNDAFHRNSNNEHRSTILSTTQQSANHQLQPTSDLGDETNTRTTFWQSDTSNKQYCTHILGI